MLFRYMDIFITLMIINAFPDEIAVFAFTVNEFYFIKSIKLMENSNFEVNDKQRIFCLDLKKTRR